MKNEDEVFITIISGERQHHIIVPRKTAQKMSEIAKANPEMDDWDVLNKACEIVRAEEAEKNKQEE